MNQDPTSHHWSPMLANPDNEFADFLDFGDLTFSAFNDATLHNHGESNPLAQADAGPVQAQMENPTNAISMGQRVMPQKAESRRNQRSVVPDFYNMASLNADLFSQQHENQPGVHQHAYHPANMVPPTPNSIEMHAGQPQYYPIIDRQQQQMYDNYQLQQRHQVTDTSHPSRPLLLTYPKMNFTPLISPAVTPLDTQLCYPDYAASSERFSPLTSPALHTQNHIATAPLYGPARGSDTSDTTSPIDPIVEYVGPTSVPATPASLRKSRRRVSTGSSKPPARTVKQSPAMKPQSKKKAASSTVIPPKEVAGILEEAGQKKKGTGKAKSATEAKRPAPYQQDSSGPDSVSPEPLSDILMPPPATPRSSSSGKSPHMSAKKASSKAGVEHDQNGEAVTPASLMHIHKRPRSTDVNKLRSAHLKEQASLAEADMKQIMEDITLPEPATSVGEGPSLKSIDTAHANTHQSTPVVSATKSSDNATKSAPATATGSTFPSPSINAVASPNGLEARKRRDSKSRPKEIPKRTNGNIEKPSPAIKPRISPSIKPLLPEGSNVSADTTALLLASKSNYQNILEGTHFPGVSYPENLSTNLTSKRTSHKIAEQGRRNRINLALQEISALLPASANMNGNGGGGSGTEGEASKSKEVMNQGTAAQQSNNSKASTVEAAIEYIRALQGELRVCKDRLSRYESERSADGTKENGTEGGDEDGTGDQSGPRAA